MIAQETKDIIHVQLSEREVLFGIVVDDLVVSETYYWKVTAIESNGAHTDSEVWTFKAI